MQHRHLELDPATPAAELPAAAIDDLLERGDLADWAPLLREIRRDPWGELADRVLDLVSRHGLYGTSPLWRTWIEELRGGEPPFHVGEALRRLRLDAGLTQTQIAAALGMTQPEVSKLERRPDVRLSTLRSYVGAVGGRLALVVRRGDGETELGPPPEG